MNTIVLKFGGSSLADSEKLKHVANKICTLYDEGFDVVAILSAQGKTTDKLISEAKELSINPNKRELDMLLSVGEQISVSKMAILLNEMGKKAVSLNGSQVRIETDSNHQEAKIININTNRINEELKNGNIVLITGFQGINSSNDITTLGRGGSDTTAVAIAAALKVKKCYIYSDVEGVFTADPHKIYNAQKLEQISYDEMQELANEGAKVLHGRCVELAKNNDISIIAKSTFSEDTGTLITFENTNQNIKSIVKNDDYHKMIINCGSHLNDLFLILTKNKINIDTIYKSIDSDYIEIVFEKSFKNKMEDLVVTEMSNLCGYSVKYYINTITTVSIIGSNIDSYLNTYELYEYLSSMNISRINIDKNKLKIYFKELLDDDILNKIHDLIFNEYS